MKKKILFYSPFPPCKSGISDYSVVLARYLSIHFDVSLCVDRLQLVNEDLYKVSSEELQKGVNPSLSKTYKVYIHGVDSIPYNDFDHIIYCIGNNPYFHNYIYQECLRRPGFVILHDYIIFYLMVGHYISRPKTFIKKAYQIGGWKALLLFADLALNLKNFLTCPYERVLPMNRELLQSKNKIMVHSDHVKNKILDEFPQRKKTVFKINMIDETPLPNFKTREDLLRKYNVPLDSFVICSFGHISETKLNDLICEATLKLKNDFSNIVYVLVGEGHFVDRFVDKKIIFKTGFTSLEEFSSWISFSDLIVNLRYTSMGETSGALVRILKASKPCIVSDDAWFAELPNDVVIKLKNPLSLQTLTTTMKDLIENSDRRLAIKNNINEFMKKHYDASIIANQIKEALES
jgi:glycosyltransferase involved in cell wall biosynthesis